MVSFPAAWCRSLQHGVVPRCVVSFPAAAHSSLPVRGAVEHTGARAMPLVPWWCSYGKDTKLGSSSWIVRTPSSCIVRRT
jgi:hypothetical protein